MRKTRSTPVSFTVTTDQKDRLEDIARDQQITVSQLVRRLVSQLIYQQKPETRDKPELRI